MFWKFDKKFKKWLKGENNVIYCSYEYKLKVCYERWYWVNLFELSLVRNFLFVCFVCVFKWFLNIVEFFGSFLLRNVI